MKIKDRLLEQKLNDKLVYGEIGPTLYIYILVSHFIKKNYTKDNVSGLTTILFINVFIFIICLAEL